MSLQISFISLGLYSVLILFAPRFLVPVAIESSLYSGRHVMLSFRNLTLLLIEVLPVSGTGESLILSHRKDLGDDSEEDSIEVKRHTSALHR